MIRSITANDLETVFGIMNSRLSCCVYDTNPALALYLRLGFEEVGRDDDVVQLSLATDKAQYG